MQKLNQNIGDPSVLAIQALAWALGDDNRAQRLLALTGLTPDGLRYGIGDTGLQAAVLGFLESHEPDLLACAVAIDVSPAALILAKRQLEGTDIYG